MYSEDWIGIIKRIIRIVKVKWWVYNRRKVSLHENQPKRDIDKLDYSLYVEYMQSLSWKSNVYKNMSNKKL